MKFTNFEYVNPLFSRAKLYVMYSNLNRNSSYISKEAIDKAIPSIFNSPIVGEFYKDKKNFGDHGAELEYNHETNEIDLVVSTQPYGIIPESAEVYWEEVQQPDGSLKDYLVIDGAYLWTGRYPDIKKAFDDKGFFGQSVELEILNGNFAIIDGKQVFDIKEFVFSAFCLLGINKASDEHGLVEPAFEQARVVTYSLDKEEFTSQFNQMIKELNFSLTNKEEISKEGGQDLVEELDNKVEEFELDGLEDVSRIIPKSTDAVSDIIEEEEDPIEPIEPVEPVVEASVVNDTDGVVANSDGTGDVDSEGFITVTDDADTFDADNSADFTLLQTEHEALKVNFESLEEEVVSLRAYKRSRELGDLKNKFTAQLTDAELDGLFTSKSELTIENLELEIFAMIGKKNFSLEPKQKSNKVDIASPKVAKEANPYGDIFN